MMMMMSFNCSFRNKNDVIIQLNPAAHTQLLKTMLSAGEIVFGGLDVHDILPQLLVYVPATHAEQEVPPSGEARLSVQTVHAPEPVLFLNVCLAQAVSVSRVA